MCSCDFDGPEAYRETVRRAKKPHRCGECDALIVVGERYLYCSGVWDGRGGAHKLCLPCSELAAALDALQLCWTFGGVLADAQELLLVGCRDDEPPPEQEGKIGALLWLARERTAA